MAKNNTIRTNINDFLYCLQCLYQGRVISNKQKTNLNSLIRDCLSNENSPSKKELYDSFSNLYYSKDTPNDYRETIYNCMNLIE